MLLAKGILPGFSCRTGYGCKSSWLTHSTKPRRALFSSKALLKKQKELLPLMKGIRIRTPTETVLKHESSQVT